MLVLHPHPRQGGTMNNKIVYNIYHAFKNLGFATLRFSAKRGVGKSQGSYDSGAGDADARASALDWLQNENLKHKNTWIAGFCFWLLVNLTTFNATT